MRTPAVMTDGRRLLAFQAVAVCQPQSDYQNQNRRRVTERIEGIFMVDDNQADNCRDTDIDKIAQRKVISRLKVLNNQRNKFEVEEINDNPSINR